MNEALNIIIPLIASLVLIIVGFEQNRKRRKLIATGIEVEGIIFQIETSSDPDSRASYPIIRFVTKEGLWITEKATESLPFLLKKENEKTVKIFYNGDNPKEFIYTTSSDFSKPSNIFIAIGIVLFIASLFFAFQYLTKQN